jgi:uncharacterized cupredoxin-like copper-binding protein
MKTIDPNLLSVPRPRALALTLAVALSMLTAGQAMAHGDKPHGSRPAALVQEQKPWGVAAGAAKAQRTIDVRMGDDMRFRPDRIEVREGETVRLRVRNSGRVMHELVIGTREELDAHAELMKKFPNMEHDEPWMAHVGPGRSGEIVWTFNRAGEFDFACLIAGHYEAGMTGRIIVAAAPPAR